MSGAHLAAVLRAIARAEGLEACAVWLAHGTVWRRDDTGALRTVCQVGSAVWLAHAATVRAAACRRQR